MKAWITKYALTEGIFVVETTRPTTDAPGMIGYRRNGLQQYAHANDWWDKEADAKVWAEKMRLRKIESHRKSIQKLEAMSFHS